MPWSQNPEIHEACVAKIHELAAIKERMRRYETALAWIEYCGAYPELAGDDPVKYFSVLATYVRDPDLLPPNRTPARAANS